MTSGCRSCCFRPLVGWCKWKGSCWSSWPNTCFNVSVPLRGDVSGKSSFGTTVTYIDVDVSVPLRGDVSGKPNGDYVWVTKVSVPLRGDVSGKSKLWKNKFRCCWRFSPLAGWCKWKGGKTPGSAKPFSVSVPLRGDVSGKSSSRKPYWDWVSGCKSTQVYLPCQLIGGQLQ